MNGKVFLSLLLLSNVKVDEFDLLNMETAVMDELMLIFHVPSVGCIIIV